VARSIVHHDITFDFVEELAKLLRTAGRRADADHEGCLNLRFDRHRRDETHGCSESIRSSPIFAFAFRCLQGPLRRMFLT
jgi:hypothetical protein